MKKRIRNRPPNTGQRQSNRGRPPKLYGKTFELPDGSRGRYAVFETKERYLFKPIPRGKTGAAHPFVLRVKEWSAFVYALVGQELRKPPATRDSDVQRMVATWQHDNDHVANPKNYELTAFVVERGFQKAWETWNVKKPWTSDNPEHFVRRYVYGHKGALQDYRRIAADTQPWPSDHRGHLLKSLFFGKPGAATRFYDFDRRTDEPFVVVTMLTEADQVRFLRGKRLHPGHPPQ